METTTRITRPLDRLTMRVLDIVSYPFVVLGVQVVDEANQSDDPARDTHTVASRLARESTSRRHALRRPHPSDGSA